MRTLLQDLRYGFRLALKSPGFTLVAVLTLAVGIAANTTVFSWIDGVLVRPIPGASSESTLVWLETLTPNGEFITTSYPDYRDYRDNLKLVSGVACARPNAFSVGEEDHVERTWGEQVSGNYFGVLGVRPVLGRVFSPDEYGDKQGGYPVAVISYGLWQRRYNGDRGVIGKAIRVNRQQLTIVGVAPPEFRGSMPGLAFEIWTPAVMGVELNTMPDWMLRDRKSRIFTAFARLAPGVSIEQARAEVSSIAQHLARMDPYTNGGISATLLPIWKGHFSAQSTLLGTLRILMAVCGVVLLIVCANVASLLLARVTARQKEFSMRMALGAGRARLVRQLLTESFTLAVLGALAGVPLALWMAGSLGHLLPPTSLPIVLDVELNADILAFTILICVVACLISGTVPALHSARADLNEALSQGGRSGTAGTRSQRMRGLLVASEVALALVALVGAGLFAKSFQIARRINPGFDARNVAVSSLYLSAAGYQVPERKLFCRQLRERLESQPGIAAVSYADIVPLGFTDSWEDLEIEGYLAAKSENMKIHRNVIAPGYLDLLRIPLVEGRDFTEQDDEKSRPVMIVTQEFARRFFAGRSVIGHKVRGWGQWFTIVGIARDSKYRRPHETTEAYFYVPFRQVYRADLAIIVFVRAAADVNQGLTALRREIHAMDPSVGVFDAMPLAEVIGASLVPEKIAAVMLGVLGTIALVLAAVGLYSVMAYSIVQRTHEIGIRMALGAKSGDVLAMVIRQGMVLTLAGIGVGVVAALAVTRLAAGLLVDVSATDPWIFTAAALFLALVALAASYVPARRATRVDPNVALRCQ